MRDESEPVAMILTSSSFVLHPSSFSERSLAMGVRKRFVLLLGLLVCGGCGTQKSTNQLIADLKAFEERERIMAVRRLPPREADAAQVVQAVVGALKCSQSDGAWRAAIGLW